MISPLKGKTGVGVLAVVVISLVVTLAFFDLFTLIGVLFLGMVCYTTDRTVGVAIHLKRQPDPLPADYIERGLFIYKRPMWTRIVFVLWAGAFWFGIGFVLGKFGFGDLLKAPMQMAAFLGGLLLGPAGFHVWANRHSLAEKADKLERDLTEGSLDPVQAAKAALERAGAGIVDLVAQAGMNSDRSKGQPPLHAEPTPTPQADHTPPADKPATPAEPPAVDPREALKKFVES
jgi:hypothetical protein